MNAVRWMLFCLSAIALVGALILSVGPIAAQESPDFTGDPLPTDRGQYFAGSGMCTSCHRDMVDETGADVSLDTAWQSSMMANAARDPYWQASVRIETLVHPELASVIEDKCATCHMPMAASTYHVNEEYAPVLDDGLVDPANPLHGLAMDGNSCTLCHQIEGSNFGLAESFSGGYAIDYSLPQGERITYSQFQSSPKQAEMMANASGYTPELGLHIQQAELCATCHTLYTPYVDDNGEIAGVFPEQMPYLEWKHGNFSADMPCQACHMPNAQGRVVTSVTGGPPRSPFSMHNFVGGNAYMQQVFLNYGAELGVTASSDHFTATRTRVLDQLENWAAQVTIPEVALEGARMRADVQIDVMTGHKFPAGFPSRRAFVHFVVTDADGNVLFESGEFDDNGRIADDDRDNDPAQFEPHYAVISAEDQVQIYETVMADVNGDVTTILLHGAGYIKNNRLLPIGFDKTTAPLDIAVRGAAYYDSNFVGGQDCVMYTVDVGDAAGPFTVTAELYYLSIGYYWAETVRDYDSTESDVFLNVYDGTPNTPVLVGAASVTVGD